jgi:hypothetical protein
MIDRQGNYYSKHQGLADRDVVEQEIRELLAVPAAGAPAANASPNQPDTSPASNS